MIATIPIWISDWQKERTEFLKVLPKASKVCILGNVEAEPHKLGGSEKNLDNILSLCQAYGRDVIIITGGHEDDYRDYPWPKLSIKLDVVFWPTFWLMFTYHRMSNGEPSQQNEAHNLNVDSLEVGRDYTFEHTFISMNGVPKQHRCLLQDILSEQDLLKYGKYSWRNIRHQGHWYTFRHWKEEQTFLDQSDPNVLFHQEIVPLVYKKCFMQLVPETHEERFFLTEKTSIPLLLNKPFLVAGSQYFHKKLFEFGFQPYSEIFDYSFDDEPDIEKRYFLITQEIKKLSKLTQEELKTLYLKVYDKCVYNKRLALRYALNYTQFPSIWQELDNAEYDSIQHMNAYHLNTFLRSKQHVLHKL